MKKEDLVEVELVSYSMKNPGVGYPGFCAVYSDGEPTEPAFFCGVGVIKRAAGTGAGAGDNAVVLGFTERTVQSTVYAYENAVVRVASANAGYAMAGCYAYDYNLLRETGALPGEWLCIDADIPEYARLRALAEGNGLHTALLGEASFKEHYFRAIVICGSNLRRLNAAHLSGTNLVVVGAAAFEAFPGAANIRCCTEPGKGFSDEEYQKGYAAYPAHYIPGVVQEQIYSACRYLEKHAEANDGVVFLPGNAETCADSAAQALCLKENAACKTLEVLRKAYQGKRCPGMIEVLYRGEGWADIDGPLGIVAAISMEPAKRVNVFRGRTQTCVSGNCQEGTLFTVLSVAGGAQPIQVRLHLDGSSYILAGDTITRFDADGADKIMVKAENVRIDLASFERSAALDTWTAILKG